MVAAYKAPPHKRAVIIGNTGQLGLSLKFSKSLYSICRYFNFFITSHIDPHEIFRAVKSYLTAYKPDLVINTIAYTSVDAAEEDKLISYHINSVFPKILAEWCLKNDATLVHFSTDYVFDGRSNKPYKEEDSPNPINQYGYDKLTAELYIEQMTNNFYIFRTSALYSPFRVNFLKKIFHKLSHPKAKGGYSFNVVNDQITIPTSCDFLLEHMYKIISTKANGIYHVVPSNYCSWYEFARLIRSEAIRKGFLSSSAPMISPVKSTRFKSAAKRPLFSVLDNSKMAKALGIEIPSWDEIFRENCNEIFPLIL